MKPSERLKGELVTKKQALTFAEEEKEKILKQLERVTIKISNYEQEIMQTQLAVPELENKGL